jgi:hypothetical protein
MDNSLDNRPYYYLTMLYHPGKWFWLTIDHLSASVDIIDHIHHPYNSTLLFSFAAMS